MWFGLLNRVARIGVVLAVVVAIGFGVTTVTLSDNQPEILRPKSDRDPYKPPASTILTPSSVPASTQPTPSTTVDSPVPSVPATIPAEPTTVPIQPPPDHHPDATRTTTTTTSTTSTTSTSSTTVPPPIVTRDGVVNGCNSYGSNCDGNPIYASLPPAVGFDWHTWPKLAAVDNGTTLTARCWAQGAPHTNYQVDPLDLGPNPYDSDIHFNVQVPGTDTWGFIPDVYFVRDEEQKLGLPECTGGSDA